MKSRTAILALLGFLLLSVAHGQNQPLSQEMAALQGTWVFVGLEVDGSQVADELFTGSKIIVQGETFTSTSRAADYKGTFKVDATKQPKTIDMKYTAGPEKGKTSRGIYELDGDTWKICLSFAGKDRPAEFNTRPGDSQVLEILKRHNP